MNSELEDRLSALGAHLDAERAAHVKSDEVVVSLATRRRTATRPILAAAASVALLGGLYALTTRGGGTHQPSPAASSVPVTTAASVCFGVAPCTPDTSVPPTTATTSQLGTLLLTYNWKGIGAYSASAGSQVQARLQARLDDLQLGGVATVREGFVVDITIPNVHEADQVAVQRAVSAMQFGMWVRPVLSCSDQAEITQQLVPNPLDTQLLPVAEVAHRTCTVGSVVRGSADSMFAGAALTLAPTELGETTSFIDATLAADGQAAFNELATACYQHDASCPTGQIALELGGWLYSVVSVQSPTFEGTVRLATVAPAVEARALLLSITKGPAVYINQVFTPIEQPIVRFQPAP
jgi:hypothetical protein